MNRRFKLRDLKKQHIALIRIFWEESISNYVGIVFLLDGSPKHFLWLYGNSDIDTNRVIQDLATRISIKYHDYVEE